MYEQKVPPILFNFYRSHCSLHKQRRGYCWCCRNLQRQSQNYGSENLRLLWSVSLRLLPVGTQRPQLCPGSGGPDIEQQVWPQTRFFPVFFFVKKSLIGPEGKLMTPILGEDISPPARSLTFEGLFRADSVPCHSRAINLASCVASCWNYRETRTTSGVLH